MRIGTVGETSPVSASCGTRALRSNRGTSLLGVVLWSSPGRRKAVVWCEDQQSLAYLRDDSALESGAGWPTAGDIVEVDFATETAPEGELRVVTRLRQQPGRALVAAHMPAVPPPPLWVTGPGMSENSHRGAPRGRRGDSSDDSGDGAATKKAPGGTKRPTVEK